MTVGYQVTQAVINGLLASLGARARDLAQDTQEFATVVGALDLIGVGFTTGDAAALTAAVAQMSTLASVYYGHGTTVPNNFEATLAVLRGTGVPG